MSQIQEIQKNQCLISKDRKIVMFVKSHFKQIQHCPGTFLMFTQGKDTNALNVRLLLNKKVSLEYIIHLFMKEKSFLNVIFAKRSYHQNNLWRIIFHQFMRGKNHTAAIFAMLHLEWKTAWINIFWLPIKK